MEIDHSGPRIRRLLLRSLIIGLAPLSPPAVRCPASPAVVLHPHSTWDHLPTRSSSVSVPAYQKTFALLSLTCHYQRPTSPLLSSLTPTTSDRFPSPPLPCCRQISFNVTVSCCSAAACRHHGSFNLDHSGPRLRQF